jgi:hypothetical protein
MEQQERHRVRVGRGTVDEVKVDPIELDLEVAERVELGLGTPPIVLVDPVVGQALEVVEVGADGPAGIGRLIGPAGVLEPVLEVGKLRVRDGDFRRRRAWS